MQQTITSPRMRAALHKKEQLADTPTQEMLAIQIDRSTQPLLPIDSRGRQYVQINDPRGYTLEMIQVAIEKYIETHASVPAVICLSAFRYFTFGMQMGFFYTKQGKRIPYIYEEGANYDVLVRGEKPFDGS